MADGSGSYNLYFGRLDTGKMKIRGVMARKGDTPEYVRRMQQYLFDVLAKARSLNELRMIEPIAREVREKYMSFRTDIPIHPSSA
jgi:DNA polymerase I